MTSPNKELIKNIGISLAVLPFVVGLFIAWAVWERTPTEMLERVDSLAIPSGWTMTDEKVTGKINFCLEKAGCPSMYRKYQLDRKYTITELKQIVEPISSDPELYNESCEISPLTSGSSLTACAVNPKDESFTYRLSQETNNDQTSYWAILTVRAA